MPQKQRSPREAGNGHGLAGLVRANNTTPADDHAFDEAMILARKLGYLHDRRAVRKLAHHWFVKVQRALDEGA